MSVYPYNNLSEFVFIPLTFPVVGAIKLTFSSDKNAIKGDPSFKQKHRLFDFATYRYSSPDSDDARPEVCFSMIFILYIEQLLFLGDKIFCVSWVTFTHDFACNVNSVISIV